MLYRCSEPVRDTEARALGVERSINASETWTAPSHGCQKRHSPCFVSERRQRRPVPPTIRRMLRGRLQYMQSSLMLAEDGDPQR